MAEIEGEDNCRKGPDAAGRYANDVVINVDDVWLKSMVAKLTSKYQQPSPRFTICRVPREIREVDNDAYDPMVVSIGPYHRGSPNLHDMEEVKWRNLKNFRHLDKYLKELKEIEPEARKCYSGNMNMEVNEFIEMMLLDGLFIIQLLSNWGSFIGLLGMISRRQAKDAELIFKIDGMLCRVGQDMLLLENQLPFFVLKHLWNLIGVRRRNRLWENACRFIRIYALPLQHDWDDKRIRGLINVEEENKKSDGILHLLHLIYLSLEPTRPAENPQSKAAKLLADLKKCTEKTSAGIKKTLTPVEKKVFTPVKKKLFTPVTKKLLADLKKCTGKTSGGIKKILTPVKKKLDELCSKRKNELPPRLMVIPSATKLDEAGVQFQCVHAKSFLDITFEQGTMKMPRLSVQDSTKSLFRNFIAFEQCFPNWGNHFTSYCSFMDDLINTPRDVELLAQSQIIENMVGSEEEVALLFNNLCKGVSVPAFKESYLGESLKKVMKHIQKPWHKWRAKLLRDYFNSPWSIISFIAAAYIIFLTSVQTYYAAFT